jgi:hypothetical protein
VATWKRAHAHAKDTIALEQEEEVGGSGARGLSDARWGRGGGMAWQRSIVAWVRRVQRLKGSNWLEGVNSLI